MSISPVLDHIELGAEDGGQVPRVVALNGQAGALLGPVSGESADDHPSL
jgi:hypothetical protein